MTAASQHNRRNPAGLEGAAEVEAGGAGPVLQVLESDVHGDLRASPAGRRGDGGVAVFGDPPEDFGHGFGLAL